MKNIIFASALALLPASLAAQQQALGQLGGMRAAEAAAPAVPAASPDRGTLTLLDPRTGKVHVVIPAGGGFVYAATGRFEPAVYTGSGYVLPDGRYMPVVGGGRAPGAGALAGKWLGWGEWTYQGAGDRCYINMEFEDGADSLMRKGGSVDCSYVSLVMEPARFVKKGTQLLDEAGRPAGSYENNVITLYEAYGDTADITTVITVSGLHFDYSEIWRGKDGREIYNISGRLFTGG